ncbi:3-isopropylmalate dehydratase small subunit [Candidatus Pelagibacter giovannonii]|uniref:3-isopropylmalate dehydratase small subunit n=2 Tax=Candidatus Pelagibacter giovannonii TaxID=2563896 RepID=A0A6H1Q4X1_9PROT|nr:3-isopropylmalate dehydratase small subunit [Candidatus Pelagibacter giovannonii]
MLGSIKTKMQKFNSLTSIPAYLPIVNIDTDMIIPKQFLKTIKRTGLGKNLFFEMRYDDNGNEIKDFILNQEPHNQSKILIAGKNFGCGSSREHAPWALLDFGITCVISSSYADIFYSNCFKNGILPITLPEEKIKELSEYSKRKEEISIDLNEEKIIFGNSEIKFDIDPFKKKCLLEGLDDIALSLAKKEKITTFEENLKNNKPWIFNDKN